MNRLPRQCSKIFDFYAQALSPSKLGGFGADNQQACRSVHNRTFMSGSSWPRAPFRSTPRKQSLVGLLLPVIDSFGEPRRSRAAGQKQSLEAFPQSAASGMVNTMRCSINFKFFILF
ncbi:UNVERIFIED_ORG: hypothetical protein HNP28_003317 [Comamonas terrigena]